MRERRVSPLTTGGMGMLRGKPRFLLFVRTAPSGSPRVLVQGGKGPTVRWSDARSHHTRSGAGLGGNIHDRDSMAGMAGMVSGRAPAWFRAQEASSVRVKPLA